MVEVYKYISILSDVKITEDIKSPSLKSPLRSPNKFSPPRGSISSNQSFKAVVKTYTNALFD
jgi:hypothetical protein